MPRKNPEELRRYQAEWRKKNPHRSQANQKRYRTENREKVIAAQKVRYAKNRKEILARVKAKHLERRKQGIRRNRPLATRKEPLACECCGMPFVMTTKGSCIDHDHTTGAFRGWLCSKCNTALGMVGDSREGVLQLLHYLDKAELLA